MIRNVPIVLSIGSIDPTGAAGLAADLRVFSYLRTAGCAVVAGVTAQNSRRVLAVSDIAPALIVRQLESVWEQLIPNAVCIGMIPSARALRAIGRFFRRLKRRPPIVVDPVLAASSGRRFVNAAGLRELVQLLSLATVVTPNASEATALTGVAIRTLADAEVAARKLAKGTCAALVTGGHVPGVRSVDILVHRGRVRRFARARLSGNMRGTGSILAAALAAYLARGLDLERAVARAQLMVRRAYRNAQPLGSGKPQFVLA